MNAIPVIPTRGTIVFPNTIGTLDIGRKSSLIALEKATKGNQLCLVQQKDPTIEYPQQEDLYEVGVLVEIRQVVKIPGGYARVMAEGTKRVKIANFLHFEPYIAAEVTELALEMPENEDLSVLRRAVNDAFAHYIALENQVPLNEAITLPEIDATEQMADILGSHLDLAVEKKQDLIEAIILKERLSTLLLILQEEIAVLELEQHVQQQVKARMEGAQREYYLREQMSVIQEELGESGSYDSDEFKYHKKFDEIDLNSETRERIEQELERLAKIPQGSPERVVIENYLDWCLALPWNTEDDSFVGIAEAEKILDEDHYGLTKVKERILEYIAVLQLTDRIKGPILCLVGPPGVGKTSLARSIAKALGRQFISSSLGGVRDESEIRGHRRTYIGAMPGRIIQALKRVKTRNPLFLFDEIDKMSSDFRGDPASAMLEVLDPEQNKIFIDHYLDIPFDLSKIVFLTTANTTQNIPRPLFDRMEIIHISGYTEDEKVQIGIRYLVPKQIEQHGLKKAQFSISEAAIRIIINQYTREAGVRSLERVLASLCRKVARIIVSGERKSATITERTIYKYLGNPIYHHDMLNDDQTVGVATALAWTEFGGETMTVEAVLAKGKGKLQLTGNLGEVMQESAKAALSYLRSFESVPQDFNECDIHIHVPQGAIPKDGPSAGITIATALYSALTNKPVLPQVAFTGEITLNGRVLPIGGLKEKLLAARRAGIKTVIIPAANSTDLSEVPVEIRDALDIKLVDHIKQVFAAAFKEDEHED